MSYVILALSYQITLLASTPARLAPEPAPADPFGQASSQLKYRTSPSRKFVRGRTFRVHELAEHKGSVKKGVFLSTFRFVGARELAAARESWRTRPHCTRAIPHPPPHRAQPFEPPSRRYAGVARTTKGGSWSCREKVAMAYHPLHGTVPCPALPHVLT